MTRVSISIGEVNERGRTRLKRLRELGGSRRGARLGRREGRRRADLERVDRFAHIENVLHTASERVEAKPGKKEVVGEEKRGRKRERLMRTSQEANRRAAWS